MDWRTPPTADSRLTGNESMKPVPPHIRALGPPDTQWFGGTVDRSKMSLRVMEKEHGKSIDKGAVSRLLGCEPNREKPRHWTLSAPDSGEADLDAQAAWLFARLNSDLAVWKKLVSEYRVDLFCGLFLERPNRGVTLSPKTMAALAERGIPLGLDIYGP